MKPANASLFAAAVLSASLAVVAGAASSASAGTKGNYITTMSGVWTGRGVIRKSSTAPRERVRCRLKSVPKNRNTAFYVRYFCLGVDIRFETTGTLFFDQTGKTLSGKLVTVGVGAFRASGTVRGKNLTLTLSGRDKKTGKPVSGVLSIRMKGNNRLSSSLNATDPDSGKRFQAFQASFSK